MEHFAGLDVLVKDTSVCIVDNTGKIVREVKMASQVCSVAAGTVRFEARIRELVKNLPDLAAPGRTAAHCSTDASRAVLYPASPPACHVRDDEVCRRLMTTPGVGPVVSLTYRATVDISARFRKSKSVGAVFGLRAPSINRARSIGTAEYRAVEMR